jgi:hypothetical protein
VVPVAVVAVEAGHDLAQGAVLGLRVEQRLEEPGQGVPGVGRVEGACSEGGHLVHCCVEDRRSELVLVGEVAVGRADAEPGVVCHVVHARFEPADGEHLAGGLDQQLAVSERILADRSGRGLLVRDVVRHRLSVQVVKAG